MRFAKSDKREMDEKGADLVFDSAARRLRVKSGSNLSRLTGVSGVR